MSIQQKIFSAVENDRLKLTEGKRSWYNYIISVQELVWARNYKDGYIIDVFDARENFLERVKIEVKLVCEFGCVHNKIFLET